MMGSNRWHEVWNNRKIDLGIVEKSDEYDLYKELKRLDGFDVNVENSEKYYKDFYNGMLDTIQKKMKGIKSIYEVGCGSGANLLLFQNREMKVGGIDYSQSLTNVAKNIVTSQDIDCDEAINLDVDEKYEIVISDSVFAYFTSQEYGMKVLEKMHQKAKKGVILLEIFDEDKKDECIQHRRALVENYDELYKGLDKIFYKKSMFEKFAKEHNYKLEFTEVKNEYYWNSKYMYNVLLMDEFVIPI